MKMKKNGLMILALMGITLAFTGCFEDPADTTPGTLQLDVNKYIFEAQDEFSSDATNATSIIISVNDEEVKTIAKADIGTLTATDNNYKRFTIDYTGALESISARTVGATEYTAEMENSFLFSHESYENFSDIELFVLDCYYSLSDSVVKLDFDIAPDFYDIDMETMSSSDAVHTLVAGEVEVAPTFCGNLAGLTYEVYYVTSTTSIKDATDGSWSLEEVTTSGQDGFTMTKLTGGPFTAGTTAVISGLTAGDYIACAVVASFGNGKNVSTDGFYSDVNVE